MTRIKISAMSFAFLCALASQAAAGPGNERLWLEAQSSFHNALHDAGVPRVFPRPHRPGAPFPAHPSKAAFFTIGNLFDGEYSVMGPDADLAIRRATWGPDYSVRYEVTGRFFGRAFSMAKPLVLRKESFGNNIRIFIEGPDVNVVFDRMAGWQDLQVDVSVGEELPPEFSLLFTGLFSVLPGFSGMSPAEAAARVPEFSTGQGKGRSLSYRFTAGGLSKFFYVLGADVNLRVDQRPWGRSFVYEATGFALGREFGFGAEDWVLETDQDFLGPRGYRLRGKGMELEVQDRSFGGRARLEYRGTIRESPEFSIFSFTLVNYIFTEY